MIDERIYVIVPQTVQCEVITPLDNETIKVETKSFPMVAGRLIAQGVHIGRMLGNWYFNRGNPEITTIVLNVRNTKELRKVSDEIKRKVDELVETVDRIPYEEFHDTNVAFYGTEDKIHTITAFGPITPEIRELFEEAIGHLELF